MSKGKKAAVFWAQETAHDSSRSRKVGRHRPRLPRSSPARSRKRRRHLENLLRRWTSRSTISYREAYRAQLDCAITSRTLQW